MPLLFVIMVGGGIIVYYFYCQNTIKKVNGSPINLIINREYKKWYQKNSSIVTGKNSSVNDIRSKIYLLQTNLVSRNVSESD